MNKETCKGHFGNGNKCTRKKEFGDYCLVHFKQLMPQEKRKPWYIKK